MEAGKFSLKFLNYWTLINFSAHSVWKFKFSLTLTQEKAILMKFLKNLDGNPKSFTYLRDFENSMSQSCVLISLFK